MKPLSMLKYIRGNIRKILPLAITVCLGSALLYFLLVLSNYLLNLNEDINISYLSNISVVIGGSEGITEEETRDINRQAYIEEVYTALIGKANYHAVSRSECFILFLKKKDNVSLMEHQKWKLNKGRYPENTSELVLSKKLAANNKLSVGSIVKKNTKGWSMNSDVEVVGIIDTDAVIGLGFAEDSMCNAGNAGTSVITFASTENVGKMNTYLDTNMGEKYELFTLEKANAMMAKITGAFNAIKLLMGVVVVITLSVLLSNVCMIQYTQRRKEQELLYAIGFTKFSMAWKSMKEIGCSCLLGYLVGIIFSMFLCFMVNQTVLNDRVTRMNLYQPDSLLWILLLPLLVTLLGMITPVKLLKANMN